MMAYILGHILVAVAAAPFELMDPVFDGIN